MSAQVVSAMDPEWVEYISQSGEPPSDVLDALRDPTWLPALAAWTTAAAAQGVVEAAEANLVAVAQMHQEGRGLDEIWAAHGPDGNNPIDWRDHFVRRKHEVEAGMLDEHDFVDDLVREACELLGQAYGLFLHEVATHEAGAAGAGSEQGPGMYAATIEEMDRHQILAKNQEVLKAAREPGTELVFLQHEDVVLLYASGNDHPASYLRGMAEAGGTEGKVRVVARGRGLNPGSIHVEGASDEEAFRSHIAQFSKKRCVFDEAEAEQVEADADAPGGGADFPATPMPDTFADVWADYDWRPVYEVYADETFKWESTNFLTYAEGYAQDPQQYGDYVWHQFVATGSPEEVNIPATTRAEIEARFEVEGYAADLYDEAVSDITRMLTGDIAEFKNWVTTNGGG